uniref:Uncharacterized protein n=1 Tax=Ananas comosus var. bracteatus TaxID=296719 RepID=A0A6V7PQF0_ANACO|nr:unnamed protein product [Ananas comosus var. bracteatus]
MRSSSSSHDDAATVMVMVMAMAMRAMERGRELRSLLMASRPGIRRRRRSSTRCWARSPPRSPRSAPATALRRSTPVEEEEEDRFAPAMAGARCRRGRGRGAPGSATIGGEGVGGDQKILLGERSWRRHRRMDKHGENMDKRRSKIVHSPRATSGARTKTTRVHGQETSATLRGRPHHVHNHLHGRAHLQGPLNNPPDPRTPPPRDSYLISFKSDHATELPKSEAAAAAAAAAKPSSSSFKQDCDEDVLSSLTPAASSQAECSLPPISSRPSSATARGIRAFGIEDFNFHFDHDGFPP